MKCLKCGYKWKRKKIRDYFSFIAKCPKCGSRRVLRYGSLKEILMIASIIIIIALTINFYNKNKDDRNYCSEEQRNVKACIEIYQPVCGWANEDIKCLKWPCASAYSNLCFACKDENVEYWTEGECPD